MKAFNGIPHDLFMAKFSFYIFEENSAFNLFIFERRLYVTVTKRVRRYQNSTMVKPYCTTRSYVLLFMTT